MFIFYLNPIFGLKILPSLRQLFIHVAFAKLDLWKQQITPSGIKIYIAIILITFLGEQLFLIRLIFSKIQVLSFTGLKQLLGSSHPNLNFNIFLLSFINFDST